MSMTCSVAAVRTVLSRIVGHCRKFVLAVFCAHIKGCSICRVLILLKFVGKLSETIRGQASAGPPPFRRSPNRKRQSRLQSRIVHRLMFSQVSAAWYRSQSWYRPKMAQSQIMLSSLRKKGTVPYAEGGGQGGVFAPQAAKRFFCSAEPCWNASS